MMKVILKEYSAFDPLALQDCKKGSGYKIVDYDKFKRD